MSNYKIAYFSAEVGIDERIKTYSGGLGILAGDTIKAMADLEVPFCAVTLLYHKGFFKQRIENNFQQEYDDDWPVEELLEDTGVSTKVNISGSDVKIKILKYEYEGVTGHKVPIFFLDTNIEENPEWARILTKHLYMGDRLSQEIILGIGGVRALDALGIYDNIEKFHMNEGHSALLTLELYKKLGEKYGWEDCFVKERCIFTTHTPIPAGHDKFDYSDFYEKLKGEDKIIPLHIKRLAGEYQLNMTLLALNFSDSHNAVSRKHMEITKEMFPDFTIDYVTNGIHTGTWVNENMAEVYDKYIKGWREDSRKLKNIFGVSGNELFEAHLRAKKEMVDFVNQRNIINCTLSPDKLTIGFARRFIAYKDAELIFKNMDMLVNLGKDVQFVFSGKAHAKDAIGKEIMKRIIEYSKGLQGKVCIAFVENYDIIVAKKLISGCDLWLNTPIPYNEASGTSGMKASANGCLHFSRLDGWAIEAFERNGGGFPINEYQDFLTHLKYKIIPMFYSDNKDSWTEEMKLAIGNSGSYFNTHRMALEYIEKFYKLDEIKEKIINLNNL